MTFMSRQIAGLFNNPGLKLVRDLGILVTGQVATKAIGFAVFVYLARVLDPAGYGALEFALALTGFAALIIDFGLGPVSVRRFPAEGRQVVASVPALRLLVTLMVFPLLVLFVFLATPDETTRLLSLLFGASLLLHAWKQEWLMQATEKMGRVALAEFVKKASFALICVAFIAGNGDLVFAALAEGVAVILWIGVFLWSQKREGFGLGLAWSGAYLKTLGREAAPLGMNAVIWGVAQFVPALVVAIIAGLEEAAWFAAAQRVVVSLQAFSYIYHFNLFAAMTRRFSAGGTGMARLSAASFRCIAWLMVGPAIIGAVFADEVMAFTFGAVFAASGPVFAILLFVLPVHFLSGHFRWGLMAAGENRSVFLAGLCGAAALLALLPGLVWFMGAVGGAIAVLVTALTISLVAEQQCRRFSLGLPSIVTALPQICAGLIAIAGAVLILGTLGWFTQMVAAGALYATIALVFDRKLFAEFRHLAYAKKDIV